MIVSDVGGFDPDYHYIVGDQKTSSKNQALLWVQGDVSRIYFYCLEHVWDLAPWSVEPEETIQQLCEKRCHQLRQQYDWLCLWLSGGYDSQTVLQSFINAGVKIDEIAYMDRLDYYQDPEVPYILAAANYYKQYHNPNLKIFQTPIDYNYTKTLYSGLGEEWLLEPGWCNRPSKSIAPFIQRFNDDVVRRRLTTKGKRADIYGKEKPKLDLYDNKWYMAVTDLTVGDSIGSDIVEFYTTGDLPELHVKQCYLAIKFFESLPECSHNLVHQVQSNKKEYYQRWNLSLGRKLIQCDVSQHGINKFYFNQTVNSPESKKLVEHFKKDRSTIPDMFISAYNNLLSSINNADPNGSILSKKWYICDYGKYRNEK